MLNPILLRDSKQFNVSSTYPEFVNVMNAITNKKQNCSGKYTQSKVNHNNISATRIKINTILFKTAHKLFTVFFLHLAHVECRAGMSIEPFLPKVVPHVHFGIGFANTKFGEISMVVLTRNAVRAGRRSATRGCVNDVLYTSLMIKFTVYPRTAICQRTPAWFIHLPKVYLSTQ